MKYVWIVIWGVVLLFFLIMFWTPLTEALSTANTTYPNANTTFLQEGIRLTPLLLWGGFLLIPVVGIVALLWKRRSGGG